MRRLLFLFIILIFGITGIFAQVIDLNDAVENRRVTLTIIGNGSSSGASLDGYIRNISGVTLRINTVIKNGLYMKNSGAGQNMAAVGLYLDDGSYYSDGKNNFIELKPQSDTPIYLIAFCTDFEKENPSFREEFEIDAMPPGIRAIISRISRYIADHEDDDLTTAAQLALWFAQGETAESVAEKFKFDSDDVRIARIISSY